MSLSKSWFPVSVIIFLPSATLFVLTLNSFLSYSSKFFRIGPLTFPRPKGITFPCESNIGSPFRPTRSLYNGIGFPLLSSAGVPSAFILKPERLNTSQRIFSTIPGTSCANTLDRGKSLTSAASFGMGLLFSSKIRFPFEST